MNIVWLLVVNALGAAIFFTMPRWLPALMLSRRLPSSVGGMRISIELARIAEDQITKQLWTIPVMFQNTWRAPVSVPGMWSVAMVTTDKRAKHSPFHFQHQGTLTFERPVHDLMLNPEDQVLGFVSVALPDNQQPTHLILRTYVRDQPQLILRGRATTVQSAMAGSETRTAF